MIQEYAWLLFATSSVSFCAAYIITLKRLSKSQKAFTELIAASIKLQEIINELDTESRSDSDIHKDNFIKFISDSRDWAFNYIDDVQKSINSIVEKTESTIDYHKSFGSLAIEPYATHITILADAVEELKTLLPNKDK
jgi:hypothetical protein